VGSHRAGNLDEAAARDVPRALLKCDVVDLGTFNRRPELSHKMRQAIQTMPAHITPLINKANSQGRGEE